MALLAAKLADEERETHKHYHALAEPQVGIPDHTCVTPTHKEPTSYHNQVW